MKTIAVIVGARPQFIKLSCVSRALARIGGIREVVIHTGQHHDAGMSEIFFQELGIAAPNHHLGIHGGGHGAMTGAMMQRLEPLLQEIAPGRVLVYGDTNSTLAGALTAAKLHIPVAHVEAGLRSFNRQMPEEINRIVVDHVSDLLFTSTETASANLRREGFADESIYQVGDVMYDVALGFAADVAARKSLLSELGVAPAAYVLATIHRADNTDRPARLAAIVDGLEATAATIPVILPLHPRTRERLTTEGISFDQVRTIAPLGYLDMATLQSHAAVIVTDSGGVQKEAFFHNVPCVTLREQTEWTELVELGWSRLVTPVADNIADAVLGAIGSRGREAYPYGNGKAAEAIAEVLASA